MTNNYPIQICHVAAGPFIYGPEICYERLAQCPPFKPCQEMDLPEFWMAKFPVTTRQWRTFLEETGHDWVGQWYRVIDGWRGTFLRGYAPTSSYPNGHDDLPIVDVTQTDAFAFCDWLSAKVDRKVTLPTEFQWEKAARGVDGRFYPWGNQKPRPEIQWQTTFPVRLETYLFDLFQKAASIILFRQDLQDANNPVNHVNPVRNFLGLKPRQEWARAGQYWRNGRPLLVGAIPQNISPYGCVDMSGNIWEWTTSLYNPDLPDFHVVKGGSWGYTIHHAALNVRSACSVTTPSRDYHAQGTGFRVIIEKEEGRR